MNIQRRPGEPVSTLLLDRQIHAGSHTRYTRVARRLETHQAVQDLGKIELEFDPLTQRLQVHGVCIFRDGKLTNHAEEDLFELFQREAGLESGILSGAVTALMVLKDLRVGDVLDLEFSIISDSPLLRDHYWISEIIGGTFPIGRQWLSWVEREDQPLHVMAPEGLGTYQRETTEFGTVRTWCFEHPQSYEFENDIPATHRPLPEISMTTFRGWQEVADLFLKPWSLDPSSREELDQELDTLRNHFDRNPVDGIAAAINLVRNNVRYLGYSPGVFALIPADPAEVWHRRYGDCKEKSRLLCWFLNELGVEAHPVLVHTAWGAALADLPPSPGCFNHAVVRIRHVGLDIWVDPTNVARQGDVSGWKHLPFRFGLPISPSCSHLVPIPGETPGASGLVVEEHARIDRAGRGGMISVTHTYRMNEADQVRQALDSRGRSAVAAYLADQVKQTRHNAVPAGDMNVSDDPRTNELTLRCDFHCQDLLKPSPDGKVDLFFLIPHSVPHRITGASSTRKSPLALLHPVDVNHTIRVNPDDPRSISIPKQVVSNEFFQFSFTTTVTPRETVHIFKFRSLTDVVPASKLRVYSGDLAKVSEALNWYIAIPPRQKNPKRIRPSYGPEAW